MMMMKSVFWWRKPEYPEETTDLRQVTDETFHTYGGKTDMLYLFDIANSHGRVEQQVEGHNRAMANFDSIYLLIVH